MNNTEDTCMYEVVSKIEDENETVTGADRPRLSLRNLYRQVLICSTIWTLYFIYGLQLGAPTVFIPQLQKEENSSNSNSTTNIDDDLSSWLSSMFLIGAIPWGLIIPVFGYKFGRRKTYISISLIGFIGALIIYLSKTVTQILIGEFIISIILAAIKSASGTWGIWVANAIGTYWHWKNIYLLMFICNFYTLTVFAWPESPYWLAKQRRFNECVKTFEFLMGKSEDVKEEIACTINSFKINENNMEYFDTKSFTSFIESLFKLFMKRTYYYPLIISLLIIVQFHMTGKLICIIYAINILKKITKNDAVAYKGMLILDGVSVFSMYCGCIVSRFTKRRKMLFTTSFLTITFLYVFSLYLFLIRQEFILENNIISITLLVFFSITVSSGPMILLTSIYGEIISFKYQQSITIIYGFINSIVMAWSIKSSLFLFKHLTLPGIFLLFAVISTIVTSVLYLLLPETKNKSSYEIEKHFEKKFDHETNSNQETKRMTILQPDV